MAEYNTASGFAHRTSWSYSRYPLQTNELNNKGMEKVSLVKGEIAHYLIKFTHAKVHTNVSAAG